MRHSYARAQGFGVGLGLVPGQRAEPAYHDQACRYAGALVPRLDRRPRAWDRCSESSSVAPGLVGHPHTRNRLVMIVSIQRTPELPIT